jgi:acyl carrier protein
VGFLTKLRGKKQEVLVQRAEPATESQIQEWLITHIAAVAKLTPEQIEVDRPFAEFGMDSMQMFQLSGELQKFLGYQISEIIAWDYPTIAKLSAHLASGAEAPADANLMSEDELANLQYTPQTEPQR